MLPQHTRVHSNSRTYAHSRRIAELRAAVVLLREQYIGELVARHHGRLYMRQRQLQVQVIHNTAVQYIVTRRKFQVYEYLVYSKENRHDKYICAVYIYRYTHQTSIPYS